MALDLPDTANLGDSGHTSDHNLILAALQELDSRSLENVFKGAWDSGTTYTAGDVVEHDGSSWLALDDSTAQMPGDAGTPTSGGGVVGTGAGNLGATPSAQSFTVGSTVTVVGVEVYHYSASAPVSSGQVVGITAADPNGTADPTLTVSGTTPAISGGGSGQITFDAPITLNPGTTYWLVFKGSAGFSLNLTTAASMDGAVATAPTLRYGASYTSVLSGWTFKFALLVIPDPVWALVAQKGADGADGADGTGWSRDTATYTTASLANNAEETGTATLAKGYRLLRVATDVAARVRVYTTAAKRTSDATRAVGTYPVGDHGVVLDFVTTADLLAADLSPAVDGFNNESTPSSSIPIAVQNLSGATDTVDVTFTYITTEE